MIKCPNCTGEMKFNAKSQKVKCEYCGSEFSTDELKEEIKSSKENNTYEGKSFSCTQCGATLMTFDDTAITFCSYCGSQAMIEEKMIKHNNPDYIIPFSKTKEECIESYKSKIKKSIFAPSYMKSDVILEKFRGIYIPYGIYTVGKKGTISNEGSKYSHSSGDYTYYDDYRITSDVDISCEGISYDLISKFYDKYSKAIPFIVKDAKEFNANYLIGYYADSSDVDPSIYESEAKEVAKSDTIKRIKKEKEYIKYGCSNPKYNPDILDQKVGMFPVYFLAIRNKGNNNVNYAIVNGQTGDVSIDIPIDFKKYIIGSILLAIIIFIIINSSFVFVPQEICIISSLVSFASMITSIVQLSKINKMKSHFDDKAYKLNNKDAENSKKEKILPNIYKSIIAMIIPIVALMANYVDDLPYYIAALISLILVVLSFRNIVNEHNIMVSNEPPQLGKRGGE